MILQKDATLEIDHTEESSDDGICEYSAWPGIECYHPKRYSIILLLADNAIFVVEKNTEILTQWFNFI